MDVTADALNDPSNVVIDWLIDWKVYFEYVKNKKRQARATVQQQITKNPQTEK